MHPLFESPKLDRELKTLIRENFREFCTGAPHLGEMNSLPMDVHHQYHIADESRLQAQPPHQMTDIAGVGGTYSTKTPPFGRSESTDASETDLEAKFSDDEETTVAIKNEETDDDDDLPLSKVFVTFKVFCDFNICIRFG